MIYDPYSRPMQREPFPTYDYFLEEEPCHHNPEMDFYALFREAQAFRAGVEGTISFLKRVHRLARCFNRGWECFVATVGNTVFAHNLLVLARS